MDPVLPPCTSEVRQFFGALSETLMASMKPAVGSAGNRSVPVLRLPRRVAQLGGTTTSADCLVALCCLVQPGKLIRGPTIAEYEEAFARQIGVRHAYSFSAGRVGLYGVLRALGVGLGDEVLLQVPTHIVVANAVRYAGAKPVYVDCRLDTCNLDLEDAERKVTARTKAILLQHTFGVPVELDDALRLADRHGLYVIEDCVHSLGATYKGRQVGSFGHAAFFSTEETKIISSTMGGMVVTNDGELARKVARFRDHCAWPSRWLTIRYLLKFIAYYFLTKPYVHWLARALYDLLGRRQPLSRPTSREEILGLQPPDYEKRLSNAQAILALRQLRRLKQNLEHRRATARAYREFLSRRGVDLPWECADANAAYVRYPVMVSDRQAALKMVAPYAVLGTWFTSVLEEALSPACGNYEKGSCPRAEFAAEHLVNLPTHPRVSQQDVIRIAMAIENQVLHIPGNSVELTPS